jgi:hypothetical protein
MSIRARGFVGSLSSGAGKSEGVGVVGMSLFLVEKNGGVPGSRIGPSRHATG